MRSRKKLCLAMVGIMCSTMLSACFKTEDKYPMAEDGVTNKLESDTVSYTVDTNGPKSDVISSAITDKKILTLTFHGLGNKEDTIKLLDELDKYNIKATFFVSGIKVAEDPEVAQMVVERGHDLGNATLTGVDLTTVDYTKKIKEIERSHEEIKKHTGVDAKYVRPGHGAVDEEVQLAAAKCGYDDIIKYSVNPQDWDGKNPDEISDYISKNKQRGAIVLLNAEKNPNVYKSISLIYEKLQEKSFEIVPLDTIVQLYKERKANQFQLEENWYDKNKDEDYTIVEDGSPDEKKVILTFDDWASDDTVDSILDTLDKYNVKATFFLIAKGVERNPSLAYTISQRGHEVANHTYSHVDLDTLTSEEIQEDMIKAHEIISKAINKEAKRYLRPPRGVMNEDIAKALSACNFKKIIMYGPSAWDWQEEKTAKDISDYMLSHSFDGAILLLHILDGISTPEALPTILEGLLNEGYEFITVGEMLGEE